jgi:hypothetical protein
MSSTLESELLRRWQTQYDRRDTHIMIAHERQNDEEVHGNPETQQNKYKKGQADINIDLTTTREKYRETQRHEDNDTDLGDSRNTVPIFPTFNTTTMTSPTSLGFSDNNVPTTAITTIMTLSTNTTITDISSKHTASDNIVRNTSILSSNIMSATQDRSIDNNIRSQAHIRNDRQIQSQEQIHRQEETERIDTNNTKILTQTKDLHYRINREGRYGWQEKDEHNSVRTSIKEQDDRQTGVGVNSRDRQAVTQREDQYEGNTNKGIHINRHRQSKSAVKDRQTVEQKEHQKIVRWDKQTETYADKYRTHRKKIQYDESIDRHSHDRTEHQNRQRKSLNTNRQTIRQYVRQNDGDSTGHTISTTNTDSRRELSREEEEIMNAHTGRQESRDRDEENRQWIEVQRVRRLHREEEGTRKGQSEIQHNGWAEEETEPEEENEVQEVTQKGGLRYGLLRTERSVPDESKLQMHERNRGDTVRRTLTRTEGQLDSGSEKARMELHTDRCDTHIGRLTKNRGNKQNERQVSVNSGQQTGTRVDPQRKYVTWWDVH